MHAITVKKEAIKKKKKGGHKLEGEWKRAPGKV